MKMSKIITLLYRDMNVSAVEKLLIEMTIYCAKQGVLNENFEVNLKQFIEGFRIVAIECINLPSGKLQKFILNPLTKLILVLFKMKTLATSSKLLAA